MDASLTFGGDLVFDATGDILLATDTQTTQQRVLRRLLTNPGAYIQHPDYGAGLARFVGQPAVQRRIAASVTQQMKREKAIAAVPVPAVTVKSTPDGTYTLTVSYTDQLTGLPAVIATPVGT